MTVAVGEMNGASSTSFSGVSANNGSHKAGGVNLENFTVVKRNGQLVPKDRTIDRSFVSS